MMEMTEGKQGLWANIHAKRKRIKAGSGERMRKPGSKGAPTDADFKAANEEVVAEAGPFSYGAKKPRKGSVADLANKKRQEQERGKQPIEPKDQMVGVAKVTKGVAEELEVKDTDDYKLDKSGKKVRAHKIIFNKGEDDGKKGVSEQMTKSYNRFVQEHTPDLTEEQLNELVAELQEVLGKDDPAGKWISDFVHSDNPKFAGKSKEKRKQMALAAYYSKMREEAFIDEEQLDELNKDTLNSYVKKAKTNYNTQTKRMSRAYGSDVDTYDDAAHKRDARKAGLKRAKSQLAVKKEETEQTNEAVVPEYDDPISRMRKKENEEKRKQKEKAGMKEELKGNQHKLDKNKNGKLDKHDFKLLRKEENVEEGMSHQAKTTMKHVENPTAGEKKAARDIKPGIKGYRDRIAMLHSAAARGGLKKEEAEQIDEKAKWRSSSAAEPHPMHDPDVAAHDRTATTSPIRSKADKPLSPGSLMSRRKSDVATSGSRTGMITKKSAESLKNRIKTNLKKEEAEQVDEAWPGTPEYEKKFPKRVTGAGARHDIKATSTGVVATRRFAADDTAEKPENAPKRGRGRPKKDKFAEAVEFLMSLNEEQFNELTSEGFDAFFESFTNVVESK